MAATVGRVPLPVPTSRASMAKAPPRLAERARLCARPDGGRSPHAPPSLEPHGSLNKKACGRVAPPPPPESPNFQ